MSRYGSNISNSKSENQSLQLFQSSYRYSLGTNSSQRDTRNFDEDVDILNYSAEQPSITFNTEIDPTERFVSFAQNIQEPKRKRRELFQKYKKSARQPSETDHMKQNKNFEQTLDQALKVKSDISQQTQDGLRRRFNRFARGDQNPQLTTTDTQINQDKLNKGYPTVDKRRNSLFADLKEPQQIKQQNQTPSRFSLKPKISIAMDVTPDHNQYGNLRNILCSPIFHDRANQHNEFVENLNRKENRQPNFQRFEEVSQQKCITVVQSKRPQNLIIPFPNYSQRWQINNYDHIGVIQQSISNRVVTRQESQRAYSGTKYIGPKVQFTFSKAPMTLNSQPMVSACNDTADSFHSGIDHKQIICGKEEVIQQQAYQEERIPIFLRKARKANSFYANLYHPQASQYYQQDLNCLHSLVYQFGHALTFLENISLQIHNKAQLSIQFTKKFERRFTLAQFLNSGWEKTTSIQNLDKLKPRGPFSKRPYEYEKLRTALKSYRQIVDYYSNVKLNFDEQRGRLKYNDIRKKFWATQWNIRLISQDLYSQTMQYDFPALYYQCLDFLKEPFPKSITRQTIQERKNMLAKLLHFKQQKEALSTSEVGLAVKEKLQRQIKLLCQF